MNTALETTFVQCLLLCIYTIQPYQERGVEDSEEALKRHTGLEKRKEIPYLKLKCFVTHDVFNLLGCSQLFPLGLPGGTRYCLGSIIHCEPEHHCFTDTINHRITET